ncbi:SRPBCC family protein [Cupriavidus respiraculi]|uniref:SRPBCC family protein n=1 Tax=Cupriavidus respiraculi TaxID=195930 RepID=UPI001C979DEA|nr:SRPBCC family protein [Cupriavidus respiraculi]MBY4948246.1 SRPBCC family protein [Cupriavidus respiraculi]
MLKVVSLVVAVLVAAVLILAATRPDSFRVERAITIDAPPDRVYALLADFREWSAWSPYEKRDPAMRRNFEGPASGPGAVYAWAGNKEVGEGRMEIVNSAPPTELTIQLDFIEPFTAHNTAQFTLAPAQGGTRVTWAMWGPSPFVSRLIGLFIDMDTMIGRDFEAGLANLKALAQR